METRDEKQSLGEPLETRDLKRKALDEMSKFSLAFRASLEGQVLIMDASMETGVAAITHIFNDVFYTSINAIDALDGAVLGANVCVCAPPRDRALSLSLSEGLSQDYIRRVIDNSNSLPPSLFIPEKAFHALVREQIARLEQPGIQCVEMVHEKLLNIASACWWGSPPLSPRVL
jgi:dynamin 1-like protein